MGSVFSNCTPLIPTPAQLRQAMSIYSEAKFKIDGGLDEHFRDFSKELVRKTHKVLRAAKPSDKQKCKMRILLSELIKCRRAYIYYLIQVRKNYFADAPTNKGIYAHVRLWGNIWLKDIKQCIQSLNKRLNWISFTDSFPQLSRNS